jgi:peptidoglycan/LPS O-acetylase OafA/YrhL
MPQVGAREGVTGRSPRERVPQLDALRFFAIMAVLVAHYWHPRQAPWIFAGVSWGELGVRLFFVLSGFLITGILIRGREFGERHPERRLFVMRQFYIRRFLRIFPVYYLVLVALVLLEVGPVRQVWPWLFSYTTNIYVWHYLQWPTPLGHFWTLAVEEQFYLMWPCVMLFIPRKWLLPFLLGLICLAPIYRLYASFHYGADLVSGEGAAGTFTLAVLDSLGLGAVLALLFRADSEGSRLQAILTRVVLPIGLLSYAALLALQRYDVDAHASAAFGQTAAALIFCWLIGSASRGFTGPFGRVLEWSPITYLGKISYGIYIFHNFVPVAFGAAAARLGIGYENAGIVNFILASLVACGVAAISWHAFEAPINRLKRHFPYEQQREPHPVLAIVHPAGAEQASRGV